MATKEQSLEEFLESINLTSTISKLRENEVHKVKTLKKLRYETLSSCFGLSLDEAEKIYYALHPDVPRYDPEEWRKQAIQFLRENEEDK